MAPAPAVDVWDFKVTYGGRPRKVGRAFCKLKLAKAIRAAAQTACRILNMGSRELLRIARAHDGCDDVRAPR